MQTIGLIGGMSWESSAEYYRILNQEVKARLGGHGSAKSLLLTVNFSEIEAMQRADRWPEMGAMMADCARRLEGAGADFLLLCTNTMHRLAPEIEAAVRIPLLHIADATAGVVRASGMHRVGLLGTRMTMEQAFYRERLEGHGLEVIVPESAMRDEVHRVIFEELCHGDIRDNSRDFYVEAMEELQAAGAEGVILGCTEIGLLIKPEHAPLPIFDTTEIHARAAVDRALAGSGT